MWPYILVDTNIWSRHLHRRDATLVDMLRRGWVVTHPFVISELQLGGFDTADLERLRVLPHAPEREINNFIERARSRHMLALRGVQLVDVHLVYAALTGRARLWTSDAGADALYSAFSPRSNPR